MRSPLYWSARLYDFIMRRIVFPPKFFEERFKLVGRELKNCKNVLDLGCGTGSIIDFLPRCNYIGIERNKKFAKYCKSRKINIIIGDILKLPINKKARFDAIIIVDVIHHVYPFHLRLLKKLPKTKKIVIVDPCYKGHVWHKLSLQLGKYLDNDGYNRPYHYLDLKEWKKLNHLIKINKITLLPRDGILLVGRN